MAYNTHIIRRFYSNTNVPGLRLFENGSRLEGSLFRKKRGDYQEQIQKTVREEEQWWMCKNRERGRLGRAELAIYQLKITTSPWSSVLPFHSPFFVLFFFF